MVVDAVRTYLDAASGLTELSRKQAVAAAKTLLRANGPSAPATVENESLPPRVGQNIQTLAGELLETSRANREAIADLVRSEVEHQLERMDVVARSEHERLVRRVAELERRLAARQAIERSLVPADAGVSSSVSSSASDDSPAATAGLDEETASSSSGAEATGNEIASEAPGTSGRAEPSDRATAEESPETAEAPQEAGGTTAKKPEARNKPRTPAKSTRARSTAKRTTKSRGGTKK